MEEGEFRSTRGNCSHSVCAARYQHRSSPRHSPPLIHCLDPRQENTFHATLSLLHSIPSFTVARAAPPPTSISVGKGGLVTQFSLPPPCQPARPRPPGHSCTYNATLAPPSPFPTRFSHPLTARPTTSYPISVANSLSQRYTYSVV